MLVSFVAATIGLVLVFGFRCTPVDELERTDETLFGMVFAYWMVYILSLAVLRFELLEGEFLVRSLRSTAAFSYFLTWACLLSLPLHRLSAVREIE